MAHRLDWERSTRKQRASQARQARRHEDALADGKRKLSERGAILRRWAIERELRCFACKTKAEACEVAKTGINSGGPWMICVSCVEARKRS